jgi:hypothetical protein
VLSDKGCLGAMVLVGLAIGAVGWLAIEALRWLFS